MFSIGRRPAISPTFVVPPQEPSAVQRQADVYRARIRAAWDVCDRVLEEQRQLFAEDRDVQLVDAMLDIRQALGLGPDGSDVPVIPGRNS